MFFVKSSSFEMPIPERSLINVNQHFREHFKLHILSSELKSSISSKDNLSQEQKIFESNNL